jgi:hypothetical protein
VASRIRRHSLMRWGGEGSMSSTRAGGDDLVVVGTGGSLEMGSPRQWDRAEKNR